MNKRRILEIAAEHVQRDGFVVYNDFEVERPPKESGGHSLWIIKRWLLEDQRHEAHERRHHATWTHCGYSGKHTHFH
jgi:hypothetical protein